MVLGDPNWLPRVKPMPVFTPDFLAKFWAQVDKSNDCWLWTGQLGTKGYGQFRDGSGAWWLPHRLSWAIANKADPGRLYVCHKCDVPACVNPKHMYLGTPQDNNSDRVQKGHQHDACGERNSQARLTRQQVVEIRNEYTSSNTTIADLARKHRLSVGAVRSMLRGQTWGGMPLKIRRVAGMFSGNRTPLTAADKIAICTARESGEHLYVIAARHSVSERTIGTVLRVYGVKRGKVREKNPQE